VVDDHRLLEVFNDVQRGLPRQGPGSDDSTLRAFSICRGLPSKPTVLDIGCGPGMQTVALAMATAGTVVATDISQEYLAELKQRTRAVGVERRVHLLAADMNALPLPPGNVDVIWSEGAAYIMGFDKAMTAWRQFLKPGGWIAATELVWLEVDPAPEVAKFFAEGYPAMAHVDAVVTTIEAAGYEMHGHFTLPERAWWDDYYAPLETKLPALIRKYEGDVEALAIVESARREIEVRRSYPEAYGYEFFVARRSRDAQR
jgi:ubiquinone/menaquinone biosynthesis C-methylase UbiE